ncbi:nuclear exosome regulator NRDE2 isoform X1 [Hypanus sabinus]|uniref:nuclear exosome regulator NRDE2 isoform X1 n=1 Tax=Hypanus sabinus TaxID=79690 RepID=UPI0028C48149|nr:nuclear exosome regulator NRDE2 isoform X1 [Hypanus sabinus]
MEAPSGSLFPAFAGTKVPCASGSEGLDWLSNHSFRTEDALQLHQRIVRDAADSVQGSPQASVHSDREVSGRLSPGSLDSGEEHVAARKKKKKKKHRRHKKEKKKNRDSYRSSSDTDPELLWDKGKELPIERDKACSDLPVGTFMWLDDLQEQTAQTFCIDRKPDPANWEYKSLYRGDLARYKRKGDVCIGLDPKKQWIIWEDSNQQKKKMKKKKEDRYYSPSGLQLLSTDTVPVYHEGGLQDQSCVALASFIPVPDWEESDSTLSGAITSVNPLGIYDASTTLWLQGKGQLEQETCAPLDNDRKINSAMMAKVERYNKLLREVPSNIQTWMEFVHFQDELMQGPGPFTVAATESEKRKRSHRITLEKKLAILERAIESNPNCAELKVARLELCKESWEPSDLVNEWKKVVFLHPNNTTLWQRYLVFYQSQFSTYSTSKVNGIYGKCLSTLAAVLDGTLVSHPALPDTEEAMLAIFLQQCHFLRQTGHSEKAIALFQALIDFTFFKPESVAGLTTKAQVEFFEPFWDSGEPRFGEVGGRGWKAWMRQQEKGGWVIVNEEGEDEEEDDDEEEIKDKSLPKWQLWMQVECARDSKHWLPWRASKAKGQTEDDCEDPDRQVLFDDIGPSMFRISKPELKFQLMASFLQFLGIPAEGALPRSCLNLALDEPALFSSGSDGKRLLDCLDLPTSGVGCVGFIAAEPRRRRAAGHCRAGEDFIRVVFQQAMPHFSGQERSELIRSWLLYEKSKVIQNLQLGNKRLKSQGKRSKKLAKNLLKESENRNDLALWKEYAHLEWLLGNVEDSRRVFDTALTMAAAQGLTSSSLCDLCLLYASLELELMGGLEGVVSCRALYVLTRFAQGNGYSPYCGEVPPVNVLKARKSYEHAYQHCLSSEIPPQGAWERPEGAAHLVTLVACFALFQYLTVGIQAADALYRQASERLIGPRSSTEVKLSSAGPSASERLATMHVALLRFHMKVGVYPLRPLCETLAGALQRFPSNPDLWRFYVQVENRSHNGSRARKFFDRLTRATKDIVLPWLFAIHAEEQRKERVDTIQRANVGIVHSTLPETGLVNRIGALFEHAVQSEAGVHCVLLWRKFLHFTSQRGNGERTKGVFYRALQHCPWAKVLYLDAVRLLPEQLQEIIDLMTEKEIRIRVPLEELEILIED